MCLAYAGGTVVFQTIVAELVQQLVYPGIARALMDSCLWVERSRRA